MYRMPDWLERNRVTTTPTRRRILLLCAAVFLIGAVIAYRNLPPAIRLERPVLLLILGLFLVPATVTLNAARFELSARLLGRSVGFITALRVSVASTAANLLPLPGAMLVRIEGLKQAGESYRAAFLSNTIIAGAWIAVTSTAAGFIQLLAGTRAVGIALSVAGIAAFAGCTALVIARVEPARRLPLGLAILGTETLALSVASARLFLVLQALGVAVSLMQVVILTLAAVAASAVGVFPGGIGLRELIAAGIAPLADLPASLGYLSAALDRVVGLVVLVPLTLLVVGGPARGSKAASPEEVGPREPDRGQP
jgi:hypothetical protein